MILYTLRCCDDHEFEAWFRDGRAFDQQAKAGEVSCPQCGSTEIVKAPMAPSVGRKRSEPTAADFRRALQMVRKHVETHCEHVGERFADEARKIHKGEAPARGIYGDATDDQHRALVDEGIEVQRLPWVPPNDA